LFLQTFMINYLSVKMPNYHSQVTNEKDQLSLSWLKHWNIINFRGDIKDLTFLASIENVTKLKLPITECSALLEDGNKIIWAGPDDWFWLSEKMSASHMYQSLKVSFKGTNSAVTDVSGGYRILRLSGGRVNEVLAQGCPLDFHSRHFKVGQSAGSVFFNTSIWVWKTSDEPIYELLVRSSFVGYVDLLMKTICKEFSIANS
jgi:sarcosine oxidase subunit gamma